MKALILATVLSFVFLATLPQLSLAQDAPQAAAPAQPMRGKGMMGRGPMAGCPGMAGCSGAAMPCGGMGMGPMGMTMMDPKTRGEAMQIRGRAMVEMGNLLIKRGKELEQEKATGASPK